MPAITSENIIGRAVVAVREHAAVRDQPLLLALLEYAPNEKGKLNIANKILHCGDTYTEPEEQDCWGHMPQLSDFFWRHIVIPGEQRSYHDVREIRLSMAQCVLLEARPRNLGRESLAAE